MKTIKTNKITENDTLTILNYPGSKKRLLNFINNTIANILPKGKTVFDIFCGTSAVGYSLKNNYRILSNDSEIFCYAMAKALVGNNTKFNFSSIEKSFFEIYNTNVNTLYSAFPEVENEEMFIVMKDIPALVNFYKTFTTVSQLGYEERNIASDYSLFTTYYSNSYFGLRQSIEIDSSGTSALVELHGEQHKREVNIPSITSLMDVLNEPMKNEQVSVKENSESMFMVILSLLTPFGILIIFFVFWFIMMGRSQGGAGKSMSFGKSKAKLINDSDKNRVTFNDVAGVDEEKEELQEIVEFLKNPKKFTDMGARIPKGVLLVGHPGTGKTLLAKAVAGEAGVPFFIISGSDFVEMFVGVGASRVRDLFEQAKKNAPCIVFIDEIDAVARRRGSGLGGGHDEREQTLNQLLVEMDGFTEKESVIVIAATNRRDILDPALLRPGRFDRQITVNYPDVKGREEILKVHKGKKPIGPDVDFHEIAKDTQGFTGADLENLLNEAAILAAREDRKAITAADIDEATMKVISGPEKKSHIPTARDKRITAVHEAGHAVAAYHLKTQDRVQQVSVVPRGMAAGMTWTRPDTEDNHMSRTKLLETIVMMMGGRAGEKTALEDICTGASNDIERATKLAKNMVTRWGLSDELGPVAYGSDNDEVFIGRDYGHVRDYSEEVAARIDTEVRRIVEGAYERALTILRENREQLDALTDFLLEYEKVNEKEFLQIMNGELTVESRRAEESAKKLIKEQNNNSDTDVAEDAAPTGTAESETETE